MALLDFLKRKKEVQKAKESFGKAQDKKQPEKKAEKVLATPKPQTHADHTQTNADKNDVSVSQRKVSVSPRFLQSKNGRFSYNIIREPHISEKATYLAEKNKYVFKVYDSANKPEIKKSVEGIYGVDVLDVNIIKIPNKKRRLGKTQGFKKGHTKALVTIKEGQKIEVF